MNNGFYLDEIIKEPDKKLTGCKKCENFGKSLYHNFCSNCGRELPEPNWGKKLSHTIGVEEK